MSHLQVKGIQVEFHFIVILIDSQLSWKLFNVVIILLCIVPVNCIGL